MNKKLAAFLAVAAMALAPEVFAQATRTWVSGVGDDVNPCSRTAPCKTFAGAISKTAAGGIINVLDPGGFGTVTITKSITIDGYGAGKGSILASGGISGVVVNAPGIKVILRNLSIEGAGSTPGAYGVRFLAGSQLSVENCYIFGFKTAPGAGIYVDVPTSAELLVKDTNFTDNQVGIRLGASAGQLLATLDTVRIENMASHGVQSAGAGSVFAVIKHSTINNNNADGVRADTSGSVFNLIDNSLSFNNGTSVNAAVAGARIRMSGNAVVNNNIGLGIGAGGTIESAGNNNIAGFSSSASPNAAFTTQ